MTAVILAGPFALLGIAAAVVALAQARGTVDHLTGPTPDGGDR